MLECGGGVDSKLSDNSQVHRRMPNSLHGSLIGEKVVSGMRWLKSSMGKYVRLLVFLILMQRNESLLAGNSPVGELMTAEFLPPGAKSLFPPKQETLLERV